jgi:hypothetical protein
VSRKKYKGKTCAYCAVPGSSTAPDHVLARGFFPVDKRDNLPEVPACDGCNGEKARLEHSVTAVVPFGSTLAGAGQYLEDLVAPRLRKNQKLARHLDQGRQYGYMRTSGGVLPPTMTIPCDSETVVELFKFIARGLAFHHWGVLMPDVEVTLFGGFVIPDGARIMESMLASKMSGGTGKQVLGGGVFTYEGVQDTKHAALTVWRMSLYGVVYAAGDYQLTDAYVTTAPRSVKAALDFVDWLSRSQAAA